MRSAIDRCFWEAGHRERVEVMRASEARAIMEEHLGEFFEVSPEDVPADLVEEVSPLFALGCAHGLSVASARRYVEWLQGTGKVSEQQAWGLQGIVDVTEEMLERVQRRSTAHKRK